MSQIELLADPRLTVVTIDDFRPGVVNGSHNGPVYSTEAPLGSASQAFRCYARDQVGLKPLPTYSTRLTKTLAVSANGLLTLGDLQVVGGAAGNFLTYPWTGYDSTTSCSFNVSYFDDNAAVESNPYTTLTGGGQPLQTSWPNIVSAFFSQAGRLTVSMFTTDPQKTASTWVLIPDPNSAAGFANGTTAQVWQKIAYVNGRMTLMGPPTTTFGIGTFWDVFFTSDLQSATNLIGGEFFSPESLGPIGAWGSVSTGEFVIIGQNGGAVVISGDIQAPSSAIYLPGVTGTGGAVGPALPTPLGLVYQTDYDGVWLWNGGNTSQKISPQVVDTVFTRAIPNFMPQQPTMGTAPKGLWINWVFFPNNWMFDCMTNAWWQCEDPLVASFQVFGRGIGNTTRYFYSSIGSSAVTGGGTCRVPIVRWDHTVPAASYRWISNPIPSPGGWVNLQAVEVCASNPTATPAKITITPTSPPGQSLFGNQNPNQSVTFTIPANTASYRAMQRLGYTDFNVCVQVDAFNATPPNAAPIIHEISLGVDRRSDMAA